MINSRNQLCKLTKKFFTTPNYCKKIHLNIDLNQHGLNSLNNDVLNIRNTYYDFEKQLDSSQAKKVSNCVEYDLYNSNLKCQSEFAKLFQNQVMAICINPSLMKNPYFIPQAKHKAKQYSNYKVGAYSCAKGVDFIRENMAKYISKRDGFNASKDEMFLLYGGMDCYQHIMSLIYNPSERVRRFFILFRL
jgi:hypothetical protein